MSATKTLFAVGLLLALVCLASAEIQQNADEARELVSCGVFTASCALFCLRDNSSQLIHPADLLLLFSNCAGRARQQLLQCPVRRGSEAQPRPLQRPELLQV